MGGFILHNVHNVQVKKSIQINIVKKYHFISGKKTHSLLKPKFVYLQPCAKLFKIPLRTTYCHYYCRGNVRNYPHVTFIPILVLSWSTRMIF